MIIAIAFINAPHLILPTLRALLDCPDFCNDIAACYFPYCCGDRVNFIHSEKCCWCCSVRANYCNNYCGMCGPKTGEPLVMSIFAKHLLVGEGVKLTASLEKARAEFVQKTGRD